MLNTLDDPERQQLWELLRRMADALELCPTTQAEAVEVCLGEGATSRPASPRGPSSRPRPRAGRTPQPAAPRQALPTPILFESG